MFHTKGDHNARTTPNWHARGCATFLQFVLLAGLLAAAPVLAADNQKNADKDTYDQDSLLKDAADFFGQSTEGLAKVIEKAFKEHGRPNGYIKGEEASGAVTVGLRYGNGTLQLKKGATRTVYWQGPSIGFDLGVGLRAGASIGYMHYTKSKTLNPS